MSDETVPLTSNERIGPANVFPNGVSSHSRRRSTINCFQWFFAILLLALFIAALVTAIVLNSSVEPPVTLLANETIPTASNLSTIEQAAQSLKILESTTVPLADEPETAWPFKTMAPKLLQEQAIDAGIKALGDRELFEESLQTLPFNTPAFRHFSSMATNPLARKLSRRGYVENHATKRLAELLNYTKPAGRHNIGHGPAIQLTVTNLDIKCDFNARYRRSDGLCNNKKFPRQFGAALIPYRRMLNPDYADGISLPRQSHNASAPLPFPRKVSLYIHHGTYIKDPNRHITAMLTVFGQFLDHEITANSLTVAREGEAIDCCALALEKHAECFPITIDDDPYYSQFNVTCMNFVRSAPAAMGFFGPRQQLNQATAFIDGSVLYGSNDKKQRHLRAMVNGTLRMYKAQDGRELLPLSRNLQDGCNLEKMIKEGKYCFESGDDRLNENLLLTTMHLIWARHHNFLAQGLQAVNPEWEDEKTFQEARKILGAQMQHIAYNEFLPVLFGKDLAAKKGLLSNVEEREMPDTYNEYVNPSIANGFAAAAYRFAHTLLPHLFNLTRENNTEEALELHKTLFNPFSLYDNSGVDGAMMAAVNTPIHNFDRFFSPEMTEKLFQAINPNNPPYHGLDVVSLNIQRGRDHGLPSYPAFRRHCGLSAVDTWEGMATVIEPDSLKSIIKMYKTPENVDLYTGAVSETPMKGAVFGPLLACLLSDQFLRLKIGDSHWYERQVGPQRFTKAQLREIYNTTLAEIICRSSDSLQSIRRYVMERRFDDTDPIVDCADIIHFNFTLWAASNQPSQLHNAKVSQPITLVRIMTENPEKSANGTVKIKSL